MIKSELLRERHFGVFQNTTAEERNEQLTELFKRIKNSPTVRPVLHESDPDGESLVVFQERVVSALSAIAEAHAGQTVLVVFHGGALSAFFKKVLGIPLHTPRLYSVSNAAISEMTWSTDLGWRLQTWNNTDHLRDIGFVNFHH